MKKFAPEKARRISRHNVPKERTEKGEIRPLEKPWSAMQGEANVVAQAE